MAIQMYAIALDKLTPERREVIHEIVKEKANGWWHNFSDLWIAGGLSPQEWRDLIRPVIKGTPSSVLVLPISRNRGWAAFGIGAAKRFKWLHRNMRTKAP